MNWVAENHVKPAVASLSLGGGFAQSIHDAVATMHAAGVIVIR
jgi:serine protease